MITHTVKSHQRQVPRSKLNRRNVLLKRLVHVRSYRRGNERPEPKLIAKPSVPLKSTDPVREKIENLIDTRLKETIASINANKGPYWKKIADFQLNYNGKEWKIVDSYDTGGYGDYEDCQLCGHKGCRYMYVIASGGEKKTIGDECVGNYIKDLNAKEIFKKHNKRLRNSIGNVKSYRDLLVNLILWETKNGTNHFLSDMKARILSGTSLSPNMVSAIKRTIEKDKPKPVASTPTQPNKDFELYSRAKGKGSNDWERGFLVSVGEQIQKGYKLSIKQVAVLERIANYK